jgi:uncharacterized protein involved in exopolysaccharide biosynthesis
MIGAGDTVTLVDIAAVVIRRKWGVLTVFLLVVGGAIGFTLITPKQYASHMKILVKNERANMIVSADGSDGSSNRGEVSETEINSEIELLDNMNLLEHVVKECGLERGEKASGSNPQERLAIATERATMRLQHDLKIVPVRKANIIQIDYLARDPHQAAAVLRQLAESYLEEHLRVHGTPGTYQFFSDQAGHYQNELRDAEAKLSQFRQEHSIVTLPEQKEAMLQRASESEAALLEADAAIRDYTEKLADLRHQLTATPRRIVTQDRTVPNQYSVEHLSTMLADLQNRRTQLLAKFRPDDRLVKEADQEIADTQTALANASKVTAAEETTDVNPLRQSLEIDIAKQGSELAGVTARRQKLAQQAQIYRSQLMSLGSATTDYENLSRTQTEVEQNYLLYAKKTEEARIAESLDRQKIANVAVAESPTEAHFASKPNVRLNLALGVLLGGFLGLGWALGSEYLEKSGPTVHVSARPTLGAPHLIDGVDNKSELETVTGLPVLATLYLSQPTHE